MQVEAECNCKTIHIAHSYKDIYRICPNCKEELIWYDPFEDNYEIDLRTLKENKKKLREDPK